LARYGLVLLCFALGMMSKPMLVTLPLVLLLLDYWPLQRVESQKLSGLVVEKLPFLAVSAAGCVIALLARHGAIHSGGSFALPHRLGNALASGIIYLGQMVYPAGLTALYPFPHSGTPVWEEALAAMLLASLSVIAWRERRTRPWLLMGWVWYLVMLMPVVGLIQISGQAHADRYTYLPQIGIYIALAWWVAQWRVSRVVLGGLMASVLGVLMVCAWKQTAYWQNSETLWVHTLACTTDNAVAHDNYGTFLYQKGRVDEAIPQFQSALAIRPNFPEADNNLGFALLQQGQVDQAIAHYQKALQIKPDYVKAHNSLGIALCQKGRVDEGIVQFQEALKIDPALAEAHNNLGNAFLQEGRVDRAIACYEKALAISPGYAPGRSNLAKALLQKHRADETIIH
jgi:Tfp pilus assembly protein PilF